MLLLSITFFTVKAEFPVFETISKQEKCIYIAPFIVTKCFKKSNKNYKNGVEIEVKLLTKIKNTQS